MNGLPWHPGNVLRRRIDAPHVSSLSATISLNVHAAASCKCLVLASLLHEGNSMFLEIGLLVLPVLTSHS